MLHKNTLVKAECQNSQQAQNLAQRSFAMPALMLQGRLMAPVQLYSITMLVKKLQDDHIDIGSDLERDRF